MQCDVGSQSYCRFGWGGEQGKAANGHDLSRWEWAVGHLGNDQRRVGHVYQRIRAITGTGLTTPYLIEASSCLGDLAKLHLIASHCIILHLPGSLGVPKSGMVWQDRARGFLPRFSSEWGSAFVFLVITSSNVYNLVHYVLQGDDSAPLTSDMEPGQWYHLKYNLCPGRLERGVTK